MAPGYPSAGRWSSVVLIAAATFGITLPVSPALAQAPGGFVEKHTDTAVRPIWTASQVQSFLPQRGRFTFPAPYNTQGVRLTNSTDCAGSDCLVYVGYSYWRNMNNHRGSDTMLIFLSLRNNGGPTLFSYNKVTDQVVKVGPLFNASSGYSGSSGEGWYFSATLPTKVYIPTSGDRALLRYDVVAKTFETIFDVTAQFGANKSIWQVHSSNDDNVHSATLKQGSSALGCMAYRVSDDRFFFFPGTSSLDECQIDKSGRYLLMKDRVDGAAGNDNRILDLENGTERTILDQNGAGGHSDNGYGYMIAVDDWNAAPGALRVWKFDGTSPQGLLVYKTTDWSLILDHTSHANAQEGVPLAQQYACGSGATRLTGPRANEIVCFRMDSTRDVLVVAQNMTNLNAAGGGDDYSKGPKGNLDVTGQYFIWTSNMGGSRLDAFIVKVPSQLLVNTGTDSTPPTVSISEPAAGATVSGLTSVAAQAADNVGVVGVQFKLDGALLDDELMGSPYAILWDTATVPNGSHTLTAVARDAAGNSKVSSTVTVTVSNGGDTTPPVISAVAARNITSSSATVAWTTNEPADSRVDFGLTTAYGTSTALDGSLVLSHSQTLTGLSPSTLYHYRVRSRNAASLLTTSGDFTFTTAPGGAGPLITHLRFEEGTATTTADLSGNGNTGTLVGATWAAGITGRGVALDGANDYVGIAHTPALNAFPLSVAVWFKTTTASGAAGVVNKYLPSSGNGYQIFFADGRLCAWYMRSSTNRIYDSTGCTLATAGYNDGQWHQAVFVVDAANGRLFVDGLQKASQPWTGQAGATSTTQEIRAGNYPGAIGGGFLAGSIDELRIYNQALSAADVLGLYQQEQPVSDVIFKDGFDSGSMGAWSAASSGSGQLAVSATAALAGTSAGLQALPGDLKTVYVQDDTPEDESRYRARFYLDPNGFDPGEAAGTFRTRIFTAFSAAPARQLTSVLLRRKAGQYAIAGNVLLDDGTTVETPFVPISDGPHFVEIDWRRASAPGVSDGAFQLWVDGAAAGALPNLVNASDGVEYVRLGAFALKAGASGALYLDEFESRQQMYIGPRP